MSNPKQQCGTCAHGRFERTPKGRIKGGKGICDCPLPEPAAMPSSVIWAPPWNKLPVKPKDGRDCPLWAPIAGVTEVTVFAHQPKPSYSFDCFLGDVAVFEWNHVQDPIPVPAEILSLCEQGEITLEHPRQLDILLPSGAVIQAWHWVVKVVLVEPTDDDQLTYPGTG